MITYTTRAAGYGQPVLDCTGLAEDDKDNFAKNLNIPNGSTYYEINGDHRLFMWDGSGKLWIEQ